MTRMTHRRTARCVLLPTLVLVLGSAERALSANAAPIAVRMVVVANFENGADVGDKPGEYQFWVEREHILLVPWSRRMNSTWPTP